MRQELIELSDWVIDEACRQTVIWSSHGLDLYVSVNLPASFWRPTMIRHVLDTIESFGLMAQSAGWTPITAWTDGFFSVHALAKA